jgi:zinc/manganese transport system substrate-binding protein
MRTIRPSWFMLLTAGVLLLAPAAAHAKIKIGASIPDLGSIASSVGGDQVEVFSIARATSDAHRVEVLPSYMVQVSRANLYLKVGLGLDQWADGIIDGSRNGKLKVLDCSRGITPLDRPASASAAGGDVHPLGNPHYWLDPRNGAIVAASIAEQLGQLDPPHAADYRARALAFARQVDAAYARQQKIARELPSRTILTYHSSWVYLAHAFELEVAATAEPVPGIPPTGRHLQHLVEVAKAKRIQAFLQEPYFSEEAGKFLSRQAGVRVVKVAPSCDTVQAGSYLAHFDAILGQIAGAPAGARP